MDTNPLGPLNELELADLEVVGFNGAPQVECGRDLAIVRQIATGRYFALADRSRPAHSEPEIAAFAEQGRLTLLPEPRPLPPLPLGTHRSLKAIRVLWVKLSFLSEFALPDPQRSLTRLAWQTLHGGEYKAVCADGESVERMLNLWGRELLSEADSCRRSSVPGRWKEVMRCADLGLCAAVAPALRYPLYKQYAAAQRILGGERNVRQTFDCLFRPEFPKVTWEVFWDSIGPLARDKERELHPRSPLAGIAKEHPQRLEAA